MDVNWYKIIISTKQFDIDIINDTSVFIVYSVYRKKFNIDTDYNKNNATVSINNAIWYRLKYSVLAFTNITLNLTNHDRNKMNTKNKIVNEQDTLFVHIDNLIA